MSRFSTIQEAVLACLEAQGLTVVRIEDAKPDTFLSKLFATDVASNAVMCLDGEEDQDASHVGGDWSPAQHTRAS